MARRRAPQNKAHPGAPENKEPFTEDQTTEDQSTEEIEGGDPDGDDLTDLVIRDTQLRRLLKAENNEWGGTVGRQDLRRIADGIRAELNGKAEFEEDDHGA